MTTYRTEKDATGGVQVPADKYWGAQTRRSLQNFKIGGQTMPLEVIRAFAVLKKARVSRLIGVAVPIAAVVGATLGLLAGYYGA